MDKEKKELILSIRSSKKQGIKDKEILEKTDNTLKSWINTINSSFSTQKRRG